MAKLTAKQERFVEEYLIDLNATQAAIRAGYSQKTARVTASKLLTKANIQAAIAERQKEIRKRNDVTIDRLIQELAYIGFSRITDVVSWTDYSVDVIASADLDESAIASIRSVKRQETITENATIVTVEVRQYDKLTALEKLAKHAGLYNTKPEQPPVVVQIIEAVPDCVEDEGDD